MFDFHSLLLKLSWTSQRLRKLPDLHIHVRTLRILQNRYQSIFGKYFLPNQIIISRAVIGIIFCLVKYHQVLHPLLTFVMLGVLMVQNSIILALLMVLSKVQFVSNKCIASWRHRHWQSFSPAENEAYMKRFVKSCKPIGIRFGIFYVVKPQAILVYLISIVRGTVRLLIAINNLSKYWCQKDINTV